MNVIVGVNSMMFIILVGLWECRELKSNMYDGGAFQWLPIIPLGTDRIQEHICNISF